jgi:hypothetical protein
MSARFNPSRMLSIPTRTLRHRGRTDRFAARTDEPTTSHHVSGGRPKESDHPHRSHQWLTFRHAFCHTGLQNGCQRHPEMSLEQSDTLFSLVALQRSSADREPPVLPSILTATRIAITVLLESSDLRRTIFLKTTSQHSLLALAHNSHQAQPERSHFEATPPTDQH